MNVNISLPRQYRAILDAEKAETGKTVSEIVRCALDLYVQAKREAK